MAFLTSALGAVTGGSIGYACNFSRQAIAITSAVSTIAAAVFYKLISKNVISDKNVTSDFKPLKLDIKRFSDIGDIDNKSMFAHKCSTLAEQNLCWFLRKMDMEEYNCVEKEHAIIVKAKALKAPAETGGAVALGVVGIAAYLEKSIKKVFLDTDNRMLTFLLSGFLGLYVGAMHLFCKMSPVCRAIEKDRADRLEDKISKLANRIESLNNNPLEKHQLQLARGYFFRALQAYVNRVEVIHHHH